MKEKIARSDAANRSERSGKIIYFFSANAAPLRELLFPKVSR